jgi:GNAT superfamily N-acetyltransferase
VSLEFREFDPATALAERRELLDLSFPENRGTSLSSIEHYSWKFRGFPSTPASYEYAAFSGESLYGYYAALPYPYSIGGRHCTVGMVCDVMTHPHARGKGVFTELGGFSLDKLEQAGLELVLGYPIRPAVMGGHLRVGWRVVFDLPMYLRPLRATSILRAKRLGWLAPLVNRGVALHRLFYASRLRSDQIYRCEASDPSALLDSARFAEFVDRWSASVKNHLVKGPEFYSWRLGAPGTEYRSFSVRRDEEVVAVAIGREAFLQGIPSFALLDLMILPDALAALPTLYQAVEAEARRLDVEAIVTIMSRYRARQYRLLRFGFLRSSYTFKVIARPLARGWEATADLFSEEDWHLMWIDSDDL